MATTVTHIVDPDGGAGHDYDSLSLWEAGEQGDLTGVRDEIAVAKCQCTGGTADGDFGFAGWDTSPSQYIKVWTDPAESYRHAGEYNATKFRIIGTNIDLVSVSQNSLNLKFDGIQFVSTMSGSWSPKAGIKFTAVNSCAVDISNCLLLSDADSSGDYYYGISLQGSSGSVGIIKIQNCVIAVTVAGDSASAAVGVKAFSSSSASSIYLYNCTLKHLTTGVETADSDAVYMRNCGLSNVDEKSSGNALAADQTNSETTPTWLSGTLYHLDSTDTTWQDQGTDLSVITGIIESKDIDGQVRSAPWDIGADEYVAGGFTEGVDGIGPLLAGAASRFAMLNRDLGGDF